MKEHSKSSKQKKSGKHSGRNSDAKQLGNLDRVAEELVGLARTRLPDGAFRGDLAGLEPDVRQDAVLLALSWFLREGDKRPEQVQHAWIAPRAIAAALKIQKRDYRKLRKREREAMQAMKTMKFPAEASQSHPSLMSQSDWTSSTLKSLVRRAIGIALRDRLITHANAGIALGVYVDGTAVAALAGQLGVKRSSIYQHLARVRTNIPDIITGIEVPLLNLP